MFKIFKNFEQSDVTQQCQKSNFNLLADLTDSFRKIQDLETFGHKDENLVPSPSGEFHFPAETKHFGVSECFFC